jgi:hypothetical protein
MKVIVVLTNRGLGRLLKEGGSQAWKLDPERARRIPYILCVQNRLSEEWGDPTHPQGQAFVIGKISGVSPAPDNEGRYIIEFSEYTEIKIPNFWEGWRNPVRYIDVESLIKRGVDPDKLTFKTNTEKYLEPPNAAPSVDSKAGGMNMAEAKKALSVFYGVPVSAIEITIRG